MKTVGSILKTARIEKGYTIEDVEKAIKIRTRFLEAIESDDYAPLPSLAYAKGFVKNYADFLGLDSGNVLAFFRRQSQDVPKQTLLPNQINKHFIPTPYRFTPRRFLMVITGIVIVLFLSYFGLQYRTLQSAPLLVIESPSDEMISTQPRVNIVGRTDTDATVVINNVSVFVRSDGKFFDTIAITPGVNTIVVTSTSRYGKMTTVERKVGYQAPN